MADDLTNADLEAGMDLFDWRAYAWGGGMEMEDDWAEPVPVVDLLTGAFMVHAQAALQDPRPETNLEGSIEFSLDRRLERNGSEIEAPTSLLDLFGAGDEDGLDVSVNHTTQSSFSPRLDDRMVDAEVDNSTRATSLYCTHPGCTYPKPFARLWELRRHMKVKHSGTKPFVCPARGCFKKQQRKAFARIDKLTSHFRSMHNADTIAECPSPACKRHFMPCDLLAVHLRLTRSSQNDSSRIIANLLDVETSIRKCPIWGCKVRIAQWELTTHIHSHTAAQVEAQPDDLLRESIFVRRHQESSDSTGLSCSSNEQAEAFQVFTICPVCQAICVDRKDFEIHFLDYHVVVQDSDGATDRFKNYYLAMAHESIRSLVTPYTMLVEALRQNSLSIWHDLSDLIPFRQQILRLLPDFAGDIYWTPVWKDLAKPNRREQLISKDARAPL